MSIEGLRTRLPRRRRRQDRHAAHRPRAVLVLAWGGGRDRSARPREGEDEGLPLVLGGVWGGGIRGAGGSGAGVGGGLDGGKRGGGPAGAERELGLTLGRVSLLVLEDERRKSLQTTQTRQTHTGALVPPLPPLAILVLETDIAISSSSIDDGQGDGAGATSGESSEMPCSSSAASASA
ncbi:hypothetical protein B0H19DRAFT_1385036 [Mycena capillaripes]|nr:hypothetical protein B0H19DRAFT_1385036 [Mycena capillaripes]